jgi:hypothetical protein
VRPTYATAGFPVPPLCHLTGEQCEGSPVARKTRRARTGELLRARAILGQREKRANKAKGKWNAFVSLSEDNKRKAKGNEK